jgi:D-alanine-D-alanine ligase
MGIISPRIRVAVLRGGPSYGYDHSLKTGAHVLRELGAMPEIYDPLDIFISKDGEWHRSGLVEPPERALHGVDVVWNGLHGNYGEDGQVQSILNSLQIPYTGSEALAASLSHNKNLAKDIYRKHGLLTPQFETVNEETLTDDQLVVIFRNFLHPVVVKPANGVHSLGIKLAHTFQELKEAIKETFKHSPKVLVEEHIRGNEVVCAVIEEAREEKLYSLVPTGNRPPEENKVISEMAKRAHEALGLRHYSSSDFIITPKGKIYILETNAMPTLHEDSHMYQSLRATGWRPGDFLHHSLTLALKKRM